MKWKIPLFWVMIWFLFLGWTNSALAFGISPPWVYADYLIPGSHYEQDIYLTQAEPEHPLKIEARTDQSEIKNWISFEPGEDFIIPAGIQQFPMRVVVNVPKDAGYETYQSKIRIRAISEGEGQVAVLVGGIVDVRLGVSGEEYSDFNLKDFKVNDIEEDWPVKVLIKLENLGNVKIRPSKVHINIYDQYYKELLESGDAVDMNWVEPFEIGEVEAEMPVKLDIGEYWAEVEIYKKGELVLKDKRYFNVFERGTIKPYITFLGISIYIWIAILAAILFLVAGFKFGFWRKILNKFGINIIIQKTN